MDVKYPDITVKLVGTSGNAFAIIGKVRQALMRARLDKNEIKEFTQEAMSNDYDNVLQTCMKWVEVT